MRAPIHSEKHYLQTSLTTVGMAASVNVVVCDAVTNASKTEGLDLVSSGAIVKAMYFEYWLLNEGNNATDILAIGKYSSGIAAPNHAQMAALGTFEGKKNIFHVHQGLSSNDGISGPYPLIKQWIAIPKSKQRMGLGDRIIVTFSNPTVASDAIICGFSTYKEYT